MPRIAVSYRRADSSAWTGRICDRLAGTFGRENVFRDIDSIEPGVDFVDSIQDALAGSDVLLVIIGIGAGCYYVLSGRLRVQAATQLPKKLR